MPRSLRRLRQPALHQPQEQRLLTTLPLQHGCRGLRRGWRRYLQRHGCDAGEHEDEHEDDRGCECYRRRRCARQPRARRFPLSRVWGRGTVGVIVIVIIISISPSLYRFWAQSCFANIPLRWCRCGVYLCGLSRSVLARSLFFLLSSSFFLLSSSFFLLPSFFFLLSSFFSLLSSLSFLLPSFFFPLSHLAPHAAPTLSCYRARQEDGSPRARRYGRNYSAVWPRRYGQAAGLP